MSEENTVIRFKCYSDETRQTARQLAEQMIEVWYLNGALLTPDSGCRSLNESYRQLCQAYRERAKEYTRPNPYVEQILDMITTGDFGCKLTLDHLEAIQGEMAIYDDGHKEFFIQLCFMLSLLRRGECFEGACRYENAIGSQYTRAVCAPDSLRFDCYGSRELYERYEWAYRADGDGYEEIPRVSQFAALLHKIIVRDILAFRDDARITEKFDEVQDRLGEEGRIMMRFPSAEPFIRVMIEAPTYALCEECMHDFLCFLNELGYVTV